MIGYLSRFVPVALSALARPDPRRVSTLTRRVWPRQVDLLGHMNQAAYAEVLEWGRLDLLLRSGAWARWRRLGVHPVVAEQRIVYRRELKPWTRFQVDTRAVAMRGRLVLFEGHLVVGDRVHARGEVGLLFVGPEGVLSAEDTEPLLSELLTTPLGVDDWRITQG